MKLIPAVFFQKQVNGVEAAAKTPERLEVFESELRAVVGGALRAVMGGALPTRGLTDGSGGTTTSNTGSWPFALASAGGIARLARAPAKNAANAWNCSRFQGSLGWSW